MPAMQKQTRLFDSQKPAPRGLTRRAMITGLLLALVMGGIFGARPAHAQAGENYVEFLIGDRTAETRKWGHVSLRVVGNGVEKIFDFGRYGKMWGRKDAAEGEPILRVWNAGQYGNYRAYHLKDGGTTVRYRFASTSARTAAVLSYFDRMTHGARRQGSNQQFTAYYANYPTFHAVKVNCTTVSIEAFMKGFPEYNVNDERYAKARSLQWYMLGEAQQFLYSQDTFRWTRIWWPLDLAAVLDEEFVARRAAQVLPL